MRLEIILFALSGAVLTAGCAQEFKSEEGYVAFCTGELTKSGLDEGLSKVACGCMYRQARASASKQNRVSISQSEFEVYFDQCMAPVFAAADASAAWESGDPDEPDFDSGGWGSESSSSYASDWGD